MLAQGGGGGGGVSLTQTVLDFFLFFFFFFFSPFFFLSEEILLHIPCWIFFSDTSHARFFFYNLEGFSYISRAGFILMWGVSLTHPMLSLYL